jgi:hypothetical protein
VRSPYIFRFLCDSHSRVTSASATRYGRIAVHALVVAPRSLFHLTPLLFHWTMTPSRGPSLVATADVNEKLDVVMCIPVPWR